MLQAIPKSDVNRIQSAQVITSLADASKELVENAIDAGARKISIRFVNNGLDLLEVTDDGSGIEEDNLEALVAKHATSKLSAFEDLDKLTSLGFRGEALSSLCSLGRLTVTTCTPSTYPMGFSTEYDHEGTMTKKTRVSANVGTTMRVENLFSTLPVRRKDFEKMAKRDFLKTTRLLQAYAAIHVKVRMDGVHIVGKSRSQIFGSHGTTGSDDLRRNIIDLFGAQLGKRIVRLQTDLSFQSHHRLKRESTTVRVDGYISHPQKDYGGQPERQLAYINSRPCQLPQLTRLVNETCLSLGANKAPFFLLDLFLPPDSYDVNVSPDKRTIFLHDEQTILEHIREAIKSLFSDDDREMPASAFKENPSSSTLVSNTLARFSLDGANSRDATRPHGPDTSLLRSVQHADIEHNVFDEAGSRSDSPDVDMDPSDADSDQGSEADQGTISDLRDATDDHVAAASDRQVRVDARRETSPMLTGIKAPVAANFHQSAGGLKRKLTSDRDTHRERQSKLSFATRGIHESRNHSTSPNDSSDSNNAMSVDEEAHVSVRAKEQTVNFKGEDETLSIDAQQTESTLEPNSTFSASPVKPLQRFVTRLNNLDSSAPTSHVHHLSLTLSSGDALTKHPEICNGRSAVKDEENDNGTVIQAGLEDETDTAEQSLTLNVSKSDFFRMTVIGQFNLGFILVLRDHDLFIVDQHASDEKSNYERLIRETVMQSQRMARPMKLELSSIEKLSIDEHLPTLLKNGFEVEVREAEEETGPGGGVEYYLTSLPVSRNIAFNPSDLQEILSLLVDGSPPASVRCTKARRMFASRACRSSIMIGTALSHDRMQAVIWHLGEMDAPWNCPHGRPTMRHLTHLHAMPAWRGDYET